MASMKIDFGYGEYLETLHSSERPTFLHKRIVKAVPVPATTDGYRLTLECGHQAMGFGDMKYPRGRMVLCKECQDMAKGRE